jgi:hypothetical protein
MSRHRRTVSGDLACHILAAGLNRLARPAPYQPGAYAARFERDAATRARRATIGRAFGSLAALLAAAFLATTGAVLGLVLLANFPALLPFTAVAVAAWTYTRKA